MRGLWKEAENQRQWFATVASAASSYKDGFFWRELVEHWFKVDGELDGTRLDPDSSDDELKLEKPLKVELSLFEKWRLLGKRVTTPRDGAFTPRLRLRRLDEPQGYLTRKGERLARASPVRQRFAFLRMVLWTEWIEPTWLRWRFVMAALAPVFSGLKWVLHWETEKAAVGTAVAALIGLLGAMGGGKPHG